jgi:hypothetical protein
MLRSKEALIVVANRPPLPHDYPMMQQLVEALEAEYVRGQEGGVGDWLDKTKPTFAQQQVGLLQFNDFESGWTTLWKGAWRKHHCGA